MVGFSNNISCSMVVRRRGAISENLRSRAMQHRICIIPYFISTKVRVMDAFEQIVFDSILIPFIGERSCVFMLRKLDCASSLDDSWTRETSTHLVVSKEVHSNHTLYTPTATCSTPALTAKTPLTTSITLTCTSSTPTPTSTPTTSLSSTPGTSNASN